MNRFLVYAGFKCLPSTHNALWVVCSTRGSENQTCKQPCAWRCTLNEYFQRVGVGPACTPHCNFLRWDSHHTYKINALHGCPLWQ